MLLSNMVAGTLTGRGGQVIAEVEQSTETKVQLSRPGHRYPGTSERIALVNGELTGVRLAMQRILAIIEDVAASGKDPVAGGAGRIIARLVLPNSAVTTIIGPGGAGINSLTERSGADLKFSDKGQSAVHNQRILTVTGEFESVSMVCEDVLDRIQADDHLAGIMTHDTASSSFGGSGAMTAARVLVDAGTFSGGTGTVTAMSAVSLPVEIAFDVSDMLAGTIVGKGGQTVNHVQAVTKANVKLSPKAQPPPDVQPGMRRVVISGPLESVHAAHMMIVESMMEKPPPNHEGAWGKAPGKVG